MTSNGGFKSTLAKYLGLEENKLNLTTGYDVLWYNDITWHLNEALSSL